MDWLSILILVVIGFFVIRVVGKILKLVIGIGIVLVIIYILTSNADAAFTILSF